MRLGIKAKQIAAVTAIVGLAVVVLSARARRAPGAASCCTKARRAASCSPTPSSIARARSSSSPTRIRTRRCASDPGLRAILESSIYGESVTGAVDPRHQAIVRASSDPTQEGMPLPPRADLATLVNASALEQLRRDLLARRPHARSAAADVARRRSLRLDSHRRLDAC